MSDGLDLRQFYQTFFEEADELLAEMERLLLDLDAHEPDPEHLNAIFRAAHSIKGGAATFGFVALTETTHLLENLLDAIRRGEMALRADMIDIFLETKDVLNGQLETYRNDAEPAPETYARICAVLQQLAHEQLDAATAAAMTAPPAVAPAALPVTAPATQPVAAASPEAAPPLAEGERRFKITLTGLAAKDRDALVEEFGNLGQVTGQTEQGANTTVWLASTCAADDLEAVACFIIDASQIHIEPGGGAEPSAAAAATAAIAAASAMQAPGGGSPQSAGGGSGNGGGSGGASGNGAGAGGRGADKDGGSIRVGVEKVDQLINLVGELVITQAMLKQTVSTLDPALHDRLLNGMEQLERNARDLQEAVMGIRMMPMDYVFSRFPRLVRDLAAKLDKKVELVTAGRATELDKGLIERIIDPLTHLVRNSLDHGIETPDLRLAAGKAETGRLALSAQHSGGNIIIEVADDGAGLDRERILAKAHAQGIAVSDTPTDEDIWQLIFAPGFSTASQVTDVSGRGVGMDVVKRNIQGMGGHVQLSSRPGGGTTTRIVLPLTLAILDGMSVKVGQEVFILPLSHVTESLQPTNDQFRSLAGDDRVLYVRGEYLPLVELHRAFAVAGAQTDPEQAIVVIMQAEDRRFALMVDQLVGQHQVVVKSLETNYRKVPGISAATILGDGSVALIVDVFALARNNRTRLNASEIVSA
ncbi:MAG: chemotaxis protein CheA [Pigmentiphaga sp.]|nr:chemotaxis protein CheA [Pigmentiphaga sp.]